MTIRLIGLALADAGTTMRYKPGKPAKACVCPAELPCKLGIGSECSETRFGPFGAIRYCTPIVSEPSESPNDFFIFDTFFWRGVRYTAVRHVLGAGSGWVAHGVLAMWLNER